MRHVHRDAGQALATPKGGTSQKIPQETSPPRISLATTVRRSEPQAPEVPRRLSARSWAGAHHNATVAP